jgi:hypothetical protein
MPAKSPISTAKKFDLEIWIPTAIIGLANFIPYPSVQGVVSVVAPFGGHHLARLINNSSIRKQRKKFNKLLEDEIAFLEQQIPNSVEPRRSDLQRELDDYRKMLSESKRDMLEFEKPTAKKI